MFTVVGTQLKYISTTVPLIVQENQWKLFLPGTVKNTCGFVTQDMVCKLVNHDVK